MYKIFWVLVKIRVFTFTIQNNKSSALQFTEEIVGDKDKDHTTGLNEEDKILRELRDMHEEVPLEDPGPNW